MENNNNSNFNIYITFDMLKEAYEYYFCDLISVINSNGNISNYLLEHTKECIGLRKNIILNKYIVSSANVEYFQGKNYFIIRLDYKNKNKNIGLASISTIINNKTNALEIADIACSDKQIFDLINLITECNKEFIRDVLIQTNVYQQMFVNEDKNKLIHIMKDFKNYYVKMETFEQLLFSGLQNESNILIKYSDLPKILQDLIEKKEIITETNNTKKRTK